VKTRQDYYSVIRCPSCTVTGAMASNASTNKHYRWCFDCNLGWWVKYSQLRHSFYRSKIAKGVDQRESV
jgi:hypothetical protein